VPDGVRSVDRRSRVTVCCLLALEGGCLYLGLSHVTWFLGRSLVVCGLVSVAVRRVFVACGLVVRKLCVVRSLANRVNRE
jgi:hypothetical protein